jgi:HAD superfamily hydrolase (TIGR01549 family)
MVKVIIFDLQGTLVENGVYPSPTRQVKNILRIDMPFSDFVMRFEKVFMTENHSSLSEAFTRVCDEFEVYPKDFLIEKLVAMWNRNKLFSKIYFDLDAVKKLKGTYKLILAANIDSSSKDLIDRFKFKELFDEILLSCEKGLSKSETGFYDSVFKENSKDEVLLVGDSLESDIATANQLGIQSVLIDRNNKREFDRKILTLNDLGKYLD